MKASSVHVGGGDGRAWGRGSVLSPVLGLGVGVVLILGGCEGGGGGKGGGAEGLTNGSMTAGVGVSAVSGLSSGGGVIDQLDFFDALERRPVVSFDEMLAGILVAANKPVGEDYAQRVAAAKGYGLVGLAVPADGTSNASVEGLSYALLRARGIRVDGRARGVEIVADAASKGLVPVTSGPEDVVTGSMLVQSLVAVGEPTVGSRVVRTSVRGLPRSREIAARESGGASGGSGAGVKGVDGASGSVVDAFKAFEVEGSGKGDGSGGAPVAPPAPVVPGLVPGSGGGSKLPDAPKPRPEPLPS